jgi:hypothetical protein
MRKGWRFVFWLGVGVVGVAIWVSWWAASGFQVPICEEMPQRKNCIHIE